MIDHTNCNHEKTRSARARCRRQIAGGAPRPKATPKEIGGDPTIGSDGKPQTPRFKSDECHTCGVEKIEFAGTDQWTGLQVFVGERCAWRVKRSDDFRAVP